MFCGRVRGALLLLWRFPGGFEVCWESLGTCRGMEAEGFDLRRGF